MASLWTIGPLESCSVRWSRITGGWNRARSSLERPCWTESIPTPGFPSPVVQVGQENFRDLLARYSDGTHLATANLEREISPVGLDLLTALLTVPTAERLGSCPKGE